MWYSRQHGIPITGSEATKENQPVLPRLSSIAGHLGRLPSIYQHFSREYKEILNEIFDSIQLLIPELCGTILEYIGMYL